MAARKAKKAGGNEAGIRAQTVVAPVDETSVRVRVKGTSTYASQYVRMRYDAAGDGPRSLGWSAPESSPRSLLTGQLDTLRRRSREQARNNPLCASILHALTSNVVGTGMRPLIADPDLQRLWRAWSGECDAHGSLDFGGLQALAFGEMVEAGECLARLRPRRPEDGLSVPLQLQLLEPEQLPSGVPAEAPLDRTINGVEFDVLERRQIGRAHV